MSEVWLSRKKWTCKYCDVTINDDVPSRQQHENGLRHIGNVERHLRQAYKKSERDQREEKDAKREMMKIEKLAQQSHAKDLASGSSNSTISSIVEAIAAEPSKLAEDKSKAKAISAWKPKDRLAAYGSALPFTEVGGQSVEDEEKVLKEWQEKQEARRKEGTAGQWETVTPSVHTSKTQEIDLSASRGSLPLPSASYVVREKEGQYRQHDNEYDDEIGSAEIKVKKRLKVNGDAEKAKQAEEEEKRLMPYWTTLRLDTGVGVKKEGIQGVPVQKRETHQIDLVESEIKQEEEAAPQEILEQQMQPVSTSMFKKRKAGAGAGAKKVRAVI